MSAPATTLARGLVQVTRRQAGRAPAAVVLRTAAASEAAALHALIGAYLDEAHLLPRSLDDLRCHASRFVVAVRGGRIVGCAELAPLSASVAEVRSLAVDRQARGLGLGRRIVEELGHQARLTGYEKLCAFTHEPGYFVRLGFSMVPHTWVPEKIAHDCQGCELFRRCGQHAVTLALRGPSHATSTTSPRSSASVIAALPAVEG